ncbi:MAG: hypothetical protein ABIT38_24210, partial [Gemmatimonadaceae bacterium]
ILIRAPAINASPASTKANGNLMIPGRSSQRLANTDTISSPYDSRKARGNPTSADLKNAVNVAITAPFQE